MSLRAVILALIVLTVTALSYGQAARQQASLTKADFQAQLQTLANDEQTQIQALETQIAAAAPAEQDNLQRQIAETKRQGEIHRLEILLNWANSEGDQARAAEVSQALENWRTPPQPQNLPQLPKGAERASNVKSRQVPGPVNNPDNK
jgi:hypothetical protein